MWGIVGDSCSPGKWKELQFAHSQLLTAVLIFLTTFQDTHSSHWPKVMTLRKAECPHIPHSLEHQG